MAKAYRVALLSVILMIGTVSTQVVAQPVEADTTIHWEDHSQNRSV